MRPRRWLQLLWLLLLVGPVVAAPPNLGSPNLCGFVYTKAHSGANTANYGFEGLADVAVTLDVANLTTTTDVKGYFQFSDVPAGSYKLRCSKTGYTPGQQTVNVSKGGMVTPQSVAMVPVGSVSQGDTTIGPGSVYVTFAADPSKQPTGDNRTNINYKQTIMEWMNGESVQHRKRGWPKEAAFIPSWDSNTLMIWNPKSDQPPDYITFDEDRKPTWLCFAGTSHDLYVSEMVDKSTFISVYGGPQGDAPLSRLPLRGAVVGMQVSHDQRWVLVELLSAPCQVVVIDAATRQISRTLPLPDAPGGLVLDGGILYAALHGPASNGYVAKIDFASGRLLEKTPVGKIPTGLALAGHTLYCVNSGSNTVTVLDTPTLKEVHQINVGTKPQKVMISPDGSRIFVSNRGSNDVSVIDGKNDGILATVAVPAGPTAMAISADGAEVYVGCIEGGALAVLDGHSGKFLQLTPTSPRSAPWGVVVRP